MYANESHQREYVGKPNSSWRLTTRTLAATRGRNASLRPTRAQNSSRRARSALSLSSRSIVTISRAVSGRTESKPRAGSRSVSSVPASCTGSIRSCLELLFLISFSPLCRCTIFFHRRLTFACIPTMLPLAKSAPRLAAAASRVLAGTATGTGMAALHGEDILQGRGDGRRRKSAERNVNFACTAICGAVSAAANAQLGLAFFTRGFQLRS